MSKLTENTIARIIACFLFTVSAAVFVLSAAAMTYVAALAVTLAQILRLLLIVAQASGRRRD